MAEKPTYSPPDERGPVKKVFDNATFAFTFVTLPLALVTAGKSFVAGEVIKGSVASLFAFGDITQIREKGKPHNEKSWYNPEKLWDRVFGVFKGSNRFKQPSSNRMFYASS